MFSNKNKLERFCTMWGQALQARVPRIAMHNIITKNKLMYLLQINKLTKTSLSWVFMMLSQSKMNF